MSKVENVNFCYICDSAFDTRKQFNKQNLNDEHLNRARKEMEDEVEDETMERLYDSDEDDNFLTHKTKTETKTESSDKTMKRVYDPDEDHHILKPKNKTQTEAKPKIVVPY